MRRLIQFLLAALLLTASGTVSADGSAEHRIRAAYLLNFAKFVRWPAGQLRPDWTFCIVAPRSLRELYPAMLDGKSAQERRVRVAVFTDAVPEDAPCDLLYLAGDARIGLRGPRPLTVGDGETVAERGGMLAFVRVGDNIRFIANLKAIREAGLDVDSQLLAVAQRVIR